MPVVPRDATVSPSEAGSTPRDRGFGKAFRLNKTDEFSSVFAFRRVIRGRWYAVHLAPGRTGSARLGVVVAKKLVRRANQRNLLKRLVREQFRKVRATLPCHDCVFRVQARIDDATRTALNADIAGLLGRLAATPVAAPRPPPSNRQFR